MKYRKLGSLEVSSIGLGCMGLSHAYGLPTDKEEAKNLIAKAIDLGYTFFDTAEIYGFKEEPHHNEILVGEALKPYRNKVKLATKFGITFDYSSTTLPLPLITDSRPETIKKSVESSLKRLQTDYIDLYYQHRLDKNIPIEDVAGIMQELINEGKILHWGLSETDEKTIRKAHKICPVTAIQNRYNIMQRHHECLFPVLEELNIGFVPFSPLANGILSDKYGKNTKFIEQNDYRATMPQFKQESFDKNKALFDLLHKLSEENNATPAQISLAWMLSKKNYIAPIPGTRKIDRLEENSGASEIILSKDEVKKIDKILNNMEMSEVFGGTKIITR